MKWVYKGTLNAGPNTIDRFQCFALSSMHVCGCATTEWLPWPFLAHHTRCTDRGIVCPGCYIIGDSASMAKPTLGCWLIVVSAPNHVSTNKAILCSAAAADLARADNVETPVCHDRAYMKRSQPLFHDTPHLLPSPTTTTSVTPAMGEIPTHALLRRPQEHDTDAHLSPDSTFSLDPVNAHIHNRIGRRMTGPGFALLCTRVRGA